MGASNQHVLRVSPAWRRSLRQGPLFLGESGNPRFLEGAGHGNLASGQTCIAIYCNSPLSDESQLIVEDNYARDEIKATPEAGTAFIFVPAASGSMRGSISRNRVINMGCNVFSNLIGSIDTYLDCEDFTIADNIIENYIYIGLKIGQAMNCTITGNKIKGGITGASTGIAWSVYNSTFPVYGVKKTAIIANNIIENSPGYGLSCLGNPSAGDAVNIVVSGNQVLDDTLGGFLFQNCENANIFGNISTDSGGDGFKFGPSTGHNVLNGNIVKGCAGNGVDFDDEDDVASWSIIGNTISEFGGTYGILVGDLAYVLTGGNKITHTAGSGKTGLRVNSVLTRQDIGIDQIAVTSGTDYSVSSPTAGGQNFYHPAQMKRQFAGNPNASVTVAFPGQILYDTSAGDTYMGGAAGGTVWYNIDILIGALAGTINAGQFNVAGTKVVGARATGYTNAMTGTANRATSYATGTITLVQLAERFKALQDDLTTHGLIGP